MKKLKNYLIQGYVYLCLIWVLFAISFQVFFLVLNYTNPEKVSDYSNQLSWKFDGTFKNYPNNIWYEKK